MDDIFKSLYACMKEGDSLFNFLSDEDIRNLSAFFEIKSILAGGMLWKKEDPYDYIAFIVSGSVEIKKETEFEGRELVVGIYSKGALCILDESLRAVTAEATEDVTLAIITQKNLDKLIETNPKLGADLLKGMLHTVSFRLRKSIDRLAVFF
ncbi:MAG: cyclic nucleotide-binding domain-containing protein [Thermodesulfovibrionia bacterium]|nr:cyclic nucleotide-binding domain-containing protein [Thermodesulfovibrionia bacterium]